MRPSFRPLPSSLALAAALLTGCPSSPPPPPPPVAPPAQAALQVSGPRLDAVGPWLISNQASMPLTVTGRGLEGGDNLVLGPPLEGTVVPLVVWDEGHAFGRLPSQLHLPAEQHEVLVEARLMRGSNVVSLRLINDEAFPDFVALEVSPDGRHAFVASQTQDRVYRVDLSTGEVDSMAAGDGPSALAWWRHPDGTWRLVVGDLFTQEVRFLSWGNLDKSTWCRVPAMRTAGLAVEQAENQLLVLDHTQDTMTVVSLLDTCNPVRSIPLDPNPRAVARLPGKAPRYLVGSLATGNLQVVDATRGVEADFSPVPGTPIIGGGTSAFSARVMNGKAPRAIVAGKQGIFYSSIGPNIGPNPEKMEVSMNGGVAAVALGSSPKVLRHLGFGAGVTEGLALDEARGLLYAADTGLGVVRVVDAVKLAASDAAAGKALLQTLEVPLPPGTPLVRPKEDFAVKGRATVSLHAGPTQLKLTPDGKTLVVLNRFLGTVGLLDVREAKAGRARFVKHLPVADLGPQRIRRLGQVLYHADLGRTAMSCDACHLEGHGEGVLFEKTRPLRIYRSPTVRGTRETPPHFTPDAHRSMGETVKVVGGRNRYHNPDLTPEEVEALTIYASLIPTPPNPFTESSGAPLDSLRLPDGTVGVPQRGLALFEGRCSGCHPAPYYTTDQSLQTRGKFQDVGTPHLMPLRESMQDGYFQGFAPPALAGAWDVFPMLTTGLAGLGVEGERVVVKDRFALKAATLAGGDKHGGAASLTPQELSDLLAFLMTL